MLCAIELIQAFVPGMCSRKFGRVVNITSAMVKSPRAPMGLSTAARSGLTAYCKGLSLEVANTIAAKRLGDPDELGDTCAFLCSRQASYISGQNIQLDGGSYPGLI